jgi:hypothetical protein
MTRYRSIRVQAPPAHPRLVDFHSVCYLCAHGMTYTLIGQFTKLITFGENKQSPPRLIMISCLKGPADSVRAAASRMDHNQARRSTEY